MRFSLKYFTFLSEDSDFLLSLTGLLRSLFRSSSENFFNVAVKICRWSIWIKKCWQMDAKYLSLFAKFFTYRLYWFSMKICANKKKAYLHSSSRQILSSAVAALFEEKIGTCIVIRKEWERAKIIRLEKRALASAFLSWGFHRKNVECSNVCLISAIYFVFISFNSFSRLYFLEKRKKLRR